MTDVLRELLTLREGRRRHVYYDTEKRLTVGIGHLLTSADGDLKPFDMVTDEQIDAWFAGDIAVSLRCARAQMAEAAITDQDFLPYLTSVNFQLGGAWTVKFPLTWKLIKTRRYADAAEEAARSLWFRQTPVRVTDFQGALRRLAGSLAEGVA